MAGRFRLYTDEDVYGPIVKGLVTAGWDVVRAVDVEPEGTLDPVHFNRAITEGRVLVSNDLDQLLDAQKRYDKAEPFPGFITWPQEISNRYPVRAFLEAFEELAAQDDPFSYPIIHLHPRA